LILSSVHLWFLASAVLAVASCLLIVGRLRQERAVGEFSELIRRLTVEPGGARIGLEGRPESLERLGQAVNRLLEHLEQRGADLHSREQLIQRLLETVHHAVLVHRQHILFANAHCLALLGMAAADVIGKPLSAFAAPDYEEWIDDNLRRRLGGEPAAECYEVELIGAHGDLCRVELSSALIDSDGEPTLVLTALEMLPEAASSSVLPPTRPRAVATLDAMGESVITLQADGRIDYLNHAAAQLLGQNPQVLGKHFFEVASLLGEGDRRPLGDPVRLASTAGKRGTPGGRAVLVPANGAAEHSVEVAVTSLGPAGGVEMGWVVVLHDTSEWRGPCRQMTYQASQEAVAAEGPKSGRLAEGARSL
jgi:PAS domain S-box-containing protein